MYIIAQLHFLTYFYFAWKGTLRGAQMLEIGQAADRQKMNGAPFSMFYGRIWVGFLS